MIPISEPFLSPNAKTYVVDCIDSNWISSKGAYIEKFEGEFQKKFNLSNAVSCSNGTSALHLALMALGIGCGDEVIVPDLTFAATINAVIHAQATPVIVDVDSNNWNISVDKILESINDRTKAIIIVHLYGNPFDVESLRKRLNGREILIIEDCAEALGATIRGKSVGSLGDAGTFSFYGNKVITTGEGGMVCFKSEKYKEKALVLRDHGMSKSRRYWQDYIGYNYRMTNIQAAIGLSQLESFDYIMRKRKHVFDFYDEVLLPLGFQRQKEIENSVFCYWLYTVLVPGTVSSVDLQTFLGKAGIETRPIFYPLSDMELYQRFGKGIEHKSISRNLSFRGLSLPTLTRSSEKELNKICTYIKEFCK